MTDFKQLCADLLAWSDTTSSHYYSQPGVIIRARAALAQPVAEGPTDEEIDELVGQCADLTLKRKAECYWALGDVTSDYIYSFTRAALARWGNSQGILDSSPQPVTEEPTDETPW